MSDIFISAVFQIETNKYAQEKVKRRRLRDVSNPLDIADAAKKLKKTKRTTRRTQVKKEKSSSGRFECDHCNKTFAWKKDLFRHEKSHTPNTSKYSCPHCERRFIRKDKLKSHILVHLGGIVKQSPIKSAQQFSQNLYSKEKFKEIRCMICNFNAANVRQLREHLNSHNNPDDKYFDLENSEYRKKFFPDKDLKEVMSSIVNKIEQQQFSTLYSIVNEHYYEMGISDSDQTEPEPDVSYVCEICNASFTRKHKLMTHLAFSHTFDECPYKCEKCNLKFTCQRVLDSHKRHHCENSEKLLSCDKCPGRFTWLKNYENHKLFHGKKTTNESFICEFCGEIFPSKKELRFHKKTKCGSELLPEKELTKCEICDKIFNYPRDLRKHKMTHIPDGKSHDCNICGEKFLRSENLRSHMKTHNKPEKHLQQKKLVCMLCQSEFKSIDKLRSHLFDHSDGETEINFENCGFVLSFYQGVHKSVISEYIRSCFNEQKLSQLYMAVNKFGLEMTLSDSDSGDEDQVNVEPKSEAYTCELCNVKFPRKQAVLHHQYAEHHSQMNEFPHECSKCNAKYVCEALLQRHKNSECQNLEKATACVKCGIKFIWKQSLVAHHCLREEKNADENKQCEVCGKKFIWPKDLQRHKRSHIPEEKKFECLVCLKKFNRKDNLRAHMKVHSTEGKVREKVTLKWEGQDENMCKPNGDKIIQCKICFSKHNTIKDLANHLLTHKDPTTLKQREAEAREISMMVYGKQMDLQTLSRAISKDLSTGLSNARFYSITNETGYELTLNDSETCSDPDDDGDDENENTSKGYVCSLCDKVFNRKFKVFEHQRTEHTWDQLPLECTRCAAKFVCFKMYDFHLKNECENNEKQFKCKQCPVRFTWKENLKNHEKYMHDKNPSLPKKYHCNACDKSFLWQKDLVRHQKVHQVEADKFECTWCFRVFMRRDNLKVHMKVHQNATHILLPDIYYLARPNGLKVAECKLCDQKYSSIYELSAHLQNIHFKINTLGALPTPASYSITNTLGYEMEIDDSETERENPEETYFCELCDASYNRRFKLLQHQQSLHYSDTIPHHCVECNFKCVSITVLNYHMRTQCMNLSKTFHCSKCTMRFMWKENLENHERLIHDGARMHTCQICKRDFATQLDLKNHTDCKPPAEVKLFECNQCDRKYNRKDRLMKHAKIHNAKEARVKSETSEAKKFLCAFCGKEVSSSSNLVIHMRRHTGEKPFKCEFCNKGFPRSSDLSCHRRTHTGERPHKCTVCDKAFSRSYKLQTHMRIHSGERPYKCTFCEKSFTQSNDLTLHVRRHTGERPYVCETCGERFIQGTALKNHRRMRGHYEI